MVFAHLNMVVIFLSFDVRSMQNFLFTIIILSIFGCGTTASIPGNGSKATASSKQADLEYNNKTYQKNIHTVQLGIRGFSLTQPIIELGSRTELELSFDDLSGEVKDYYYTVIQCDANWEPSELNSFDYIDGFNEERITDYSYSFNTLQSYVHYRVTLPNFNMRLTKSGNYLLVVYDGSLDYPVLSQRFYVVNSQASVLATAARTRVLGSYETHQQVQFTVNYEGLDIINPNQEVKVNVMQNKRQDNMVKAIRPQFVKQNQLLFKYQTKMSFEGLQEFRDFDIRSLRFLGEHVQDINSRTDGYDVTLKADKSRAFQSYYYERDYNGGYIIETHEGGNDELESDYAWVKFRLSAPTPFTDGDVHIFGELTNWAANENSKMEYNYESKVYEKKLYLKQGFYDYAYAFQDKQTKKVELKRFEGASYQTENNYTIFVYYRPFAGRYDQLIGVQRINTVLN